MLYLAYPIDLANKHPMVVSGRSDAEMALSLAGESWFSPGAAFTIDPDHDGTPLDTIAAINDAARAACGGVLAILVQDVVTLGVAAEIERALAQGQPVAILLVGDPRSMERMSVQVRAWGLGGAYVTGESTDAVAWLRAQEASKERAPGPNEMWVTGPGCNPTRHYHGDAGFDLYVHGGTDLNADNGWKEDDVHGYWIPTGRFTDVDSGLQIQLPDGLWGRIIGRSSTIRNKGLLVTEAVIDSGWRGDLFAGVWNLTGRDVFVPNGTRLAQFIPMTNHATCLSVKRVDRLGPSDRGTNGFGSSGT